MTGQQLFILNCSERLTTEIESSLLFFFSQYPILQKNSAIAPEQKLLDL
ncbi:MAG: hypothetical protein MK289_22495 [Trichodesmium sp. ALOHA_ZT_67]|nr:hypothetical protein [Trichodesmium sp. ALOHA_ZT_67]